MGGQFDLMAITQLDTEINKLVAEQDAILAAAAPGQAKCEAAIKAAEEHLAAAKGEQWVAAKAFDTANKEQAECEAANKAAEKAVKDNTRLSNKLEKSLNSAEVDVELFDQGARETFKQLCERTTPPPQTELQAEEEEAATSVPMVDEPAVEIKEPEMPAVAVA